MKAQERETIGHFEPPRDPMDHWAQRKQEFLLHSKAITGGFNPYEIVLGFFLGSFSSTKIYQRLSLFLDT